MVDAYGKPVINAMVILWRDPMSGDFKAKCPIGSVHRAGSGVLVLAGATFEAQILQAGTIGQALVPEATQRVQRGDPQAFGLSAALGQR